jgi:hypothetical protein
LHDAETLETHRREAQAEAGDAMSKPKWVGKRFRVWFLPTVDDAWPWRFYPSYETRESIATDLMQTSIITTRSEVERVARTARRVIVTIEPQRKPPAAKPKRRTR